MTINVPEHSTNNAEPHESVRVHRISERAGYDAVSIHPIVDAALIAHVGTVRDGLPVVIPMFCVREDNYLLLHGAPAAGAIRRGRGVQVCATMTIVDGLVLARSGLHHSMNYRSVVIIGTAEVVDDADEKQRLLEIFVDRLVPGSNRYLRPNTAKEVRGTAVLKLSLEHASTKYRTGSPVDEDQDYELPIWAGVVPLTATLGEPIPDPRNLDGVELPDEVAAIVGRTL